MHIIPFVDGVFTTTGTSSDHLYNTSCCVMSSQLCKGFVCVVDNSSAILRSDTIAPLDCWRDIDAGFLCVYRNGKLPSSGGGARLAQTVQGRLAFLANLHPQYTETMQF